MTEILGISLILLAGTVVIIVYLSGVKKRPNGLLYPPGPTTRYPILGNLLDIPTTSPWLAYKDMRQQYGNIIHFKVLGSHIIIINSEEIAHDLLDKRSPIYSDRPEIPLMRMTGWDIHTGLKHPDNGWRLDRRMLHQKLRSQAASSLYPIHLSRTRALLHNLLHNPKEFVSHFRLYPTSTIMYVMYGHEVSSHDDPLVRIAFESLFAFSGSVFPGQTMLNIFPALRHLPSWFPGLRELNRQCARSRALLNKLLDIPFKSVKRNMEQGTAVPSWTSYFLERNTFGGKDVIPEEAIKALGAGIFSGAIETLASFLTTFTLAMVLYPDVQVRAQAEIDAVINSTRLPTYDDRASLPYTDALIRELFRWHGPTPFGIPHSTLKDDVYNGYYIPKGTTILTNLWAMWRDEHVYPNADQFNPDRFLSPEGTLTNDFPPAFGFGRRACVGKSMADASVWIAVVSILSVFRIAKAKNESGNDIEVYEAFSDSIVSDPLPFQCSITPRSEAVKQLIIASSPAKFDSNPMYYEEL